MFHLLAVIASAFAEEATGSEGGFENWDWESSEACRGSIYRQVEGTWKVRKKLGVRKRSRRGKKRRGALRTFCLGLPKTVNCFELYC